MAFSFPLSPLIVRLAALATPTAAAEKGENATYASPARFQPPRRLFLRCCFSPVFTLYLHLLLPAFSAWPVLIICYWSPSNDECSSQAILPAGSRVSSSGLSKSMVPVLKRHLCSIQARAWQNGRLWPDFLSGSRSNSKECYGLSRRREELRLLSGSALHCAFRQAVSDSRRFLQCMSTCLRFVRRHSLNVLVM